MGRKSLKDEMGVLERYNQLAPKVFTFVSEMLDSEAKSDRQWAADWIKAGYAKMIPQRIGGDPDNRTPIPVFMPIEIINKHGLPVSSSTETNSK